MKAGSHLLGIGGIVTVTVGLVGLIWFATTETIRLDHKQTKARIETVLTGQALGSAARLGLQIAIVDQTLSQVAAAWERDPASVNLPVIRDQAIALNGLAKDLLLADQAGIIRQSTLPDAIGRSIGAQDYFIALSDRSRSGGTLYLGPASIGPILRQWHVNAARPLLGADGSFAGVVSTDYRVDAITQVLDESAVGAGGLALVVGLTGGRLRGIAGAAPGDPDVAIKDSALFAVLQTQDAGLWTGRSPIDADPRIHAFRRIAGSNLAVVIAMDEQDAMAPAVARQRQSLLSASGATVLLVLVAWLSTRRLRSTAGTSQAAGHQAEALASATAEAEVYRLISVARTEQLEAALGGSGDGICIIDRHLCLAEWNDRLAILTGIPPQSLRVGMSLEEMLRLQHAHGQFSPVDDLEAEINLRMSGLRNGPYPTVKRQRPNGWVIEIRRKALPDGGFVAFFTDVTELTRNAEAMIEARAALDAAHAATSSLHAAVIGEIRPRLGMLRAALVRLEAASPGLAQTVLVAEVAEANAALSSAVDMFEELARIEAGGVAVQWTLIRLRGLIDGVVQSADGGAAARGAVLRYTMASRAPHAVYSDAGHVQRILTLLVGVAMANAQPRTVWIEALPGRTPAEGAVLMVHSQGGRLGTDGSDGNHTPGSDLALAVCGKLASLIDATVGRDRLETGGGEGGDAVWLALPTAAVPARSPIEDGSPGPDPDERGPTLSARRLPRTRILLVEDMLANQMVTATLLRREGHLVDIAGSGADAIEAVRHRPYDLIFMDILMPGMSGQDAASAIRTLPEPARSVPILALTADVATSDSEATLKRAGLSGLLSKPATLTELLDAIGTYAWYRHEHENRTRRPPPVPDGNPAAPPVLATDRLLELRSNLPPETFIRLVEECLVDLEHQMPALRRAINGRATSAVTAHGHAMVGMAAGYGMASLEAVLRSLVDAARAGDLSLLGTDPAAQVAAELGIATRALREMMQDVLA
jgi:CheY-like chemotaxis protein/HAMP domain-containing protein